LEHAQIDWRLARYADLLHRRAIGIGGPLLQRVSMPESFIIRSLLRNDLRLFQLAAKHTFTALAVERREFISIFGPKWVSPTGLLRSHQVRPAPLQQFSPATLTGCV
jgi:hypothetical protein